MFYKVMGVFMFFAGIGVLVDPSLFPVDPYSVPDSPPAGPPSEDVPRVGGRV